MRIFSKKALEFHHPKDYGVSCKVEMQNFATVPDWVPDSVMFKHAQKDGDVEVIENKQDEIAAEKGAGKPQGNRGNNRGNKNKNNAGDGDTGDGNGSGDPDPDNQGGDDGDNGAGGGNASANQASLIE